MDFTFARFALNMAMASSRTEANVMLKAGAPAFLVGMLTNPNELVRGIWRRLEAGGQNPLLGKAVCSPLLTKPRESMQVRGGEGFQAVTPSSADAVVATGIPDPTGPIDRGTPQKQRWQHSLCWSLPLLPLFAGARAHPR